MLQEEEEHQATLSSAGLSAICCNSRVINSGGVCTCYNVPVQCTVHNLLVTSIGDWCEFSAVTDSEFLGYILHLIGS